MSEITEQLATTEGRDWLTMHFVLGELTEQQSAEFDAAMLNDSTLCDAVVHASRLMLGIALACESTPIFSPVPVTPPVPVSSRSRGRRMGIEVIASAVMGVMAAFVYSQFLPLSSFVPVTSLESPADVDAFVSLLPDETTGDVGADDEDFAFLEDSLTDLTAPEWLLTAVELEQDQTDANTPVDSNVY